MVISNLGLKLGQADWVQTDRVHQTQGLEVIEVPMTAELRRRVRRRLSLPDGEEIALALPTGTVLVPGSVLYQTDSKVYIVTAELEEVLVLHPASVFEAARMAHFIGNFHRDMDISGDTILVLYEPALEIRLQKMGYSLRRDKRPFLGRAHLAGGPSFMNDLDFLRLLQLNDTQFPVGSFAYSNGLETYAQQGMKRDDLEAYLHTQLVYGWGRLDLAALALSYERSPQALCDELTAWKVIPSVCQASIKLGQRLLNLSKRLYPQLEIHLTEPHQAVVMGLLGKTFDMDRSWLMLAYAQSTLTNTLVMATRCMSLSPEQAQEILVRLQPVLASGVKEVLDNPQEAFYAATPASDIRAHQQAYLYTRLFQS